MPDIEKKTCRTPTQGRDGSTQIPMWKYDCVRRAILDAIEDTENGRVLFKELPSIVQARLTSNQLAKLGSVGWHVTTVKLNMEVEGELIRISGARPQTLTKTVDI